MLDVIPEVEEEEDHVARRLTTWKEEDELMSKMTVAFAVGITGDMRIGYAVFFSLPKRHFDDGFFSFTFPDTNMFLLSSRKSYSLHLDHLLHHVNVEERKTLTWILVQTTTITTV